MAPLPTSRRPGWLPGAVLAGVAVLVAASVGWMMRAPWWLYLGLVLAVLLAMGQAERLLARRAQPRAPRARGRLKIIPGGKKVDLEEDDPSHRQRWLM